MKKLFLIVVILNVANLKSQQLDSVKVSSANITALDTIYLNVYGKSDYGTVTSKNYSLNANVVNVNVNTCSGSLYTPFPFKSTIKINPLNVGTYKIKVALKEYNNLSSPCTDLTSTNYDSLIINVTASTLALKQNNNSFSFVNIAPNPFQNTIKLNLQLLNTCSISIFNNLGKVVFVNNKYLSNHDIDLSFLSSGIYYLKAQNNLEQKTFKLIKN